jgi:hypothetical protein
MRRATQRWQSIGRSVGLALIVQTGKQTPYKRTEGVGEEFVVEQVNNRRTSK